MYSSVSPGLGPGAPRSVATATDFWIAIERSFRVWSLVVASLMARVAGSRVSMGVQLPWTRASLTEVASSPVLASMTGVPPASSLGTKKVNRSVASSVAVVPETLAKRRVRVPPGVEVLGVETALVVVAVPRIAVESTRTNWRLLGRMSTRSRLVRVWPAAMSTVIRYCRGKLGPVAVSSSGPI